jgi:hypothetical protein
LDAFWYKTPIKTNVVSHGLCKEAYQIFKLEIERTFPTQVYKDLVVLTLQAREAVFFVDLKKRVITILSASSQR